VELVEALKGAAILIPILLIVGGFGGTGSFISAAMNYGLFAALGILAAIVAGAIAVPILLPWLPGRAFALKGACAGLAAFAVVTCLRAKFRTGAGALERLGLLLLVTAFSSYYAMYFTGASTFTSLSGVKKEMRWALPLQIGAGVAGFALWVASLFTA
jgi:hypothetical protein